MMNLAEKIKIARLKKNYTQEQVAQELLVSRQTISNWENGKSLPDILSIIKISELYEISLDEFLKGGQTLLKKLEKDVETSKTEKKLMKFAWISIVIGVILLTLRETIKGNSFIDFLNGALPWILLGLSFLFFILYLNKNKTE